MMNNNRFRSLTRLCPKQQITESLNDNKRTWKYKALYIASVTFGLQFNKLHHPLCNVLCISLSFVATRVRTTIRHYRTLMRKIFAEKYDFGRKLVVEKCVKKTWKITFFLSS